MEKRLFVQLNGNRKVLGILRGYDVFLNIVLDEAVEEKAGGERQRLGMVVRMRSKYARFYGSQIFAGYSREFGGYAGSSRTHRRRSRSVKGNNYKEVKAHQVGYLEEQESQPAKGYYTRAGSLRTV